MSQDSNEKQNVVEVNIGSWGNDVPPIPGKACVVIDGTPIKEVKSFTVEASAGSRTKISVEFYGKVNGTFKVQELSNK